MKRDIVQIPQDLQDYEFSICLPALMSLLQNYEMKSLYSYLEFKEVKELRGETEKDLVLTLLYLPDLLDKSLEAKSLNEIADYIYKLTSIYNKFYSEHKVLVEENKDLQESWLVLTNVICKVNMLLLDVLGIKVPNKM